MHAAKHHDDSDSISYGSGISVAPLIRKKRSSLPQDKQTEPMFEVVAA